MAGGCEPAAYYCGICSKSEALRLLSLEMFSLSTKVLLRARSAAKPSGDVAGTTRVAYLQATLWLFA